MHLVRSTQIIDHSYVRVMCTLYERINNTQSGHIVIKYVCICCYFFSAENLACVVYFVTEVHDSNICLQFSNTIYRTLETVMSVTPQFPYCAERSAFSMRKLHKRTRIGGKCVWPVFRKNSHRGLLLRGRFVTLVGRRKPYASITELCVRIYFKNVSKHLLRKEYGNILHLCKYLTVSAVHDLGDSSAGETFVCH